jgi:large subunit ribosomal protein L24
MSKVKIKKGDTVVVLAGKDKGKRGKVLAVFPKSSTCIVEKVNMVKRHTRPNPKLQQGGIIEKAAHMPTGKVMLIAPAAGKPVRIGRKLMKDGTWVRYSKKYNEVLDK